MRAVIGLVFVFVLALVPVAGARALRKPRHGGFQVKVGTFAVQAGQDRELCEYRRLPNRKPIDVNAFALRMPPEAHHFVIWSYGGKITDDSRFPGHPVDSVACAGIAPDDPLPQVLIPIQTPNSRLHFPKGVALRLDANAQVFLNPHLRNFESYAITPDIRFNFYRARKGTVRHLAEGLIAGNIGAIRIPARGEQTITAEWTAPVNLTVIQIATHQHRLGTYADIELVHPDGSPEVVYENRDWQHPLPYWPSPAIRLEKGAKMRITCTWHNTDDHEVRFGPKTTDEMCFILGFYYRDDGDTAPVALGECIPATRGLLCPFAPAIAQ